MDKLTKLRLAKLRHKESKEAQEPPKESKKKALKQKKAKAPTPSDRKTPKATKSASNRKQQNTTELSMDEIKVHKDPRIRLGLRGPKCIKRSSPIPSSPKAQFSDSEEKLSSSEEEVDSSEDEELDFNLSIEKTPQKPRGKKNG